MLALLLATAWLHAAPSAAADPARQAPAPGSPNRPRGAEGQAAQQEGATEQDTEASCPEPPARPRFWIDAAVAASSSLAVAMLKPDIRRALLHDASFSNVVENFAHPVRQIRRGTERDTDPFWVNNVAHPGLFALEGLYLKRRGYGDGRAFLFTQVHSVAWEFVVEGSAFEPSGKDLIADAAGAAGAIWVLRPVAEKAARRVAAGQGRWWDGVLRWLDPVSRIAPRRSEKPPAVSLQPVVGRHGLGLLVSVRH